jgi:predicted methyltransferase
MVRTCSALAAVFVSFLALSVTAGAQAQTPSYVAAAVGDSDRPAADKEADAIRQPADTISFSTTKPGDIVAEFLPGRGYYTRILSNVVGAEGKVYAIVPQENLERRATAADGVNAIAAEPDHTNVQVTSPSMAAFETPEPVDIGCDAVA